MALQSRQRIGGEFFQILIASAIGFFLKFGDVLLVILHHQLHVSAIEGRS